MDKEPRKATDLLLDLESKIDTILLLIKNQDLNIKLISNKLNDIINNTNVNNNQDNKKIIVESIDSFNNIENNQKIITNSDFISKIHKIEEIEPINIKFLILNILKYLILK